jgi:outer membrane protein TolC
MIWQTLRLRFPAPALLCVFVGLSGCQSVGDQVAPEVIQAPSTPTIHQASASGSTGDSFAETGAVPPAAEYSIDLEAALRIAGVDNPTIAIAQEAIRGSEAEQLQARALLLPTLHGGIDYNRHHGSLQSSNGILREVDRQSLYAGAGAASVGAGTVAVPGALVFAHLADAVFEPRATGQLVAARRFDADATRNTVLLEVADHYFRLVGAEERLRAIQQSQGDLDEVVRATANFVRVGQGRQGDADRARDEAILLTGVRLGAQEDVAVAAAELARLLSADPTIRFRGPDGPIPMVELVDPKQSVESLHSIALANRPELGARAAVIAANATRLREERLRPLFPFLTIGFSAGAFGGNNLTETSFGHTSSRVDFDVSAFWSLENLGFGNRALMSRRRAAVIESQAERLRVANLIRDEVAEAHAQVTARRSQFDVARRQLTSADEGHRLDLLRAKNLQGLPIEVLHSWNLLATARQDFIRALIEYNQAQFRLFVAMGQPPV